MNDRGENIQLERPCAGKVMTSSYFIWRCAPARVCWAVCASGMGWDGMCSLTRALPKDTHTQNKINTVTSDRQQETTIDETFFCTLRGWSKIKISQ